MAVQKVLKRKPSESEEEHGEDNENYLSDESDFYGDEATKYSYEKEVRSFDAHECWSTRTPSLIEIAQENLRNDSQPKTSYLYNPFEGHSCGRQLGETIEQFLERLPPETTRKSFKIPWIYIANPFRKRPEKAIKVEEKRGVEAHEEGAMADEEDWPEYIRRGEKLLSELTRARHQIERENVGRLQQTITKKMNPIRDAIVTRLLALAVDMKCASGKWMIFCEPQEVNAVWRIVARGTTNNELGRAAKVAPDGGDDRNARLICIYTENFNDVKDVTRVAAKLREYGVIGIRGIYYKCNAYTYLNLGSGNEHGIKASLYNSATLLKNARVENKVVDLLSDKNGKDGRDWRPMVYE